MGDKMICKKCNKTDEECLCYQGFRVWKIDKKNIPEEILSGTKEEINKLEELKNENNWNETYAIRIGKRGLK